MKKGYRSHLIANRWEEGTLCGNGTLGAIVMAHPTDEHIILTHERLFVPIHEKLQPVDTASHMQTIREMLADGEYQKSADYVVALSQQQGYEEKRWTDPLFPVCDLQVNLAEKTFEQYERSLDFETGLATVSFNQNGSNITKRFFTSRKDEIGVFELSSDSPISLQLALSTYVDPQENTDEDYYWELYKKDEVFHTPTIAQQNNVVCYRRAYKKSEQGYEVYLTVKSTDGTCRLDDDGFSINEATKVLAFVQVVPLETMKTTDKETFKNQIDALPSDFDVLLERHADIHRELFNRVELHLSDEPEMLSEELCAQVSKEHIPASFLEKIFYAGRYAILCSSGKWPPNLQGIWTGTYQVLWSSDYTQNGNVQTAIANLLNGNMEELMMSYFNYLEWMLPDMRINAQRLFGCRGIHLASRTSDHGLNNHFDETWPMTFWTAGAGWAAKFFYDYWLYTGDNTFFQEHALPFMKETVLFYEDFLLEDESGKYVFTPSYSPENAASNTGSQACVNATMDIAVAREVLNNLIHGCTTLSLEQDNIEKWKQMIDKMPPYLINEDGALKEWAHPDLHDEYDHRHASHLYPLFYGIAKEFKQNQELFEACKKAYEIKMERKEKEEGVMAFGLVQAGMAASHLGDTKMVETLLSSMARNNYYYTFASSHDAGPSIFNTDISGGLPALMLESIVQSNEVVDVSGKIISYEIILLPSLPNMMKSGSVCGVKLRGGFEASLTWENGKIVSHEIKNPLHNEYTIQV